MRCPGCGAENRAGRRFCNTCGVPLAAICAACGFTNDPDDRFCGGCGAPLASGPLTAAAGVPEPPFAPRVVSEVRPVRSAVEGERKRVTVLFADVRGSLALIESRDPEEAQRLLDPVIAAMGEAIHRFEGTVAKVLGDGVMALFGAPRAHEDHAARACYAALAIRDEVARAAAEPGAGAQVRIGLHSGEVVLRTTGTDLSLDYDAIGPTVHLAARMEQLAAPGTIRLTADVVRLAEGLIRVEPLGAVEVKGLPEPVTTFELVGIGAGLPRTRPPPAYGPTRLVGRDAELAALERALDAAGQGRGQVVAAVGDPGLGKSRLFEEFLRSPRLGGWRVLAASCPSCGRTRPWLPVIALLKDCFGVEDRDDQRAIGAKVLGALAPLGEAMRPARVACLALLDVPVDDREWRALDPPQRRRRTLDAVRELLLREAERQPLALLVEDLHWIDDDTQALLDGLVDGLPASRLLLLVNYRPEYAHGWGNRTFYTQRRIDPLPEDGAGRLLGAPLGGDTGLASVRGLLLARAEGNPLFLEESVRALAEAGTLTGEPGAYRLNREPAAAAIDLPATVQAIVAARIDRLPDGAKHVLQRAAVVGREVSFAVLRAIAELSDDELRRQLATLRAAEFLYETRFFPEPNHAFKHALTHEVAYGGLLRETRRRLHRRVGETLEALYPGRVGELAEALAEHFERGEAWGQAARYALQAAEKAKSRYAYGVGIGLAERALAAAERSAGLDAEAVRADELLGDLASLLDEVDRANRHYDQALERATDPALKRRIGNKRHRPQVVARAGARIAFYEHGSGNETLLFMNPVIYGVAAFQPIVERLCPEFRIITVEPRGTGASDPLIRPYTVRDHAEDARAVIEAAGGAPMVGVGTSRGGNLLVHLAVTAPALLSKLILVDALAEDIATGGVAEFRSKQREQAALSGDELEEAVRRFVSTTLSEPGTEELREQRVGRVLALPKETVLSFFDWDPDMNIVPLLDRVRVPTLIMHGTADRRIPFEVGRSLAARIPGAQLYPFVGRCHLPAVTATQEFCDVLRAFVRTGQVPEAAAGLAS